MRSAGWDRSRGYVVSNASDLPPTQVDPSGINTNSVTAGWFGALAKAYPQAVKKAGMGGQNTPSILQPETKYEFGAEAQGWHVVDFLEPPVTVENWAPYVEDYQSKGVEALWPADTANLTPFAQAMTTAGYHPAFIALGTQFANATDAESRGRQPQSAPGLRRDGVVAPLDGLAEPLDRAARQRHAHLRQGRHCRLRR